MTKREPTNTRKSRAPAIQLALESATNADNWISSESQFQECAAKLLDSLGLLWCHVPNGGLRDKRTAAALKRQGVKPGVPDVMIFQPVTHFKVDVHTGCAIELKYGKNRPTSAQKGWLVALQLVDWYSDVAYSMEDVIAILDECGYITGMEE